MEEQVVKKRAWVKNAVIVFLSAMLVLTFFSNTIMNRSLPEVATAYVESGTINAKIRGSGTVTAGESYEVVLDQTRKIASVLVQTGDQVQAGDVLFTLDEAESKELKDAQDTLDSLRVEYQRMLLNMDDADYARENREIEKARKSLAEAQARVSEASVSSDQIHAAQTAVKDAQRSLKELEAGAKKQQEDTADTVEQYNVLEAKIKTWEQELETLSDSIEDYEKQIRQLRSGTGDLDTKLKQAENALKTAKTQVAQLRLTYGADYDELRSAAEQKANGSDVLYMMEAMVEGTNGGATDGQKKAYRKLQPALDALDAAQAAVDMYQALVDDQSSVQAQISALQDTLDDAEDRYSALKKEVKTANKELSALEDEVTGCKAQSDWYETQIEAATEQTEQLAEQLAQLQEKKSSYDAAVQEAEACQDTLDDLLFSLAEQKKIDGKQSATQQLELEQQQKAIAEQEETVAELQANALGGEVTAKVSGQISSLNITAGREATAGETLAVIELVDRGYTVRIGVTNEQSRKVRVGDNASVTNYYWGEGIEATLTQIINDSQNPGKGKLLVFTLTGDISTGQNVTLSVGEKSANYDAIIPNSALRSDTNGNFVLVVTGKSSPLGNRFIATRVDVSVLAQDDTTAAVSGLSAGDYVITTSSKPLEAGMQVNMMEN